MNRFIMRLVLILGTAAASASGALAVTTPTTSISCSATSKLQAKIDAVPAGTVATINVSGICSENVVVPAGKTIILQGAGASPVITAADVALAAITSYGNTTIRKLKVSNTAGTGGANTTLIWTPAGGVMEIIASDILGTGVESVIGTTGSNVSIINSRIIGGTYDAVDIWGGSTAYIAGTPTQPIGPTGRFETYIRSTGNTAISCSQGSTLNVRALTAGSAQGHMTIEQSGTGVGAHLCQLTLWNHTGIRANFQIKGNSTGISADKSGVSLGTVRVAGNAGNGLTVRRSTIDISNSDVTANGMSGLDASQTTGSIGGSTFSNVQSDVVAESLSSIILEDNPPSTFPKATIWNNSFICGHMGQVELKPGGLVQNLGTKYQSCIMKW